MPFLFWKAVPSYPLPKLPISALLPPVPLSSQQLPCTPAFFTLHSRVPFPRIPGATLPSPCQPQPLLPALWLPREITFLRGFDSQIRAALMGSALYSNTQHRSGCWALCLLHALAGAVLPLSMDTSFHSFRYCWKISARHYLQQPIETSWHQLDSSPCYAVPYQHSSRLCISGYTPGLVQYILHIMKHHSEVSHVVALESTVMAFGTWRRPGSCLCHLAIGSELHFLSLSQK